MMTTVSISNSYEASSPEYKSFINYFSLLSFKANQLTTNKTERKISEKRARIWQLPTLQRM